MKTAFILRYLISYIFISPLFPMVFVLAVRYYHISQNLEMDLIQHFKLYRIDFAFSIVHIQIIGVSGECHNGLSKYASLDHWI